MKERPILFSGEMVRAILDGRKTQTRRVVKPQPVMVSDLDGLGIGEFLTWRKNKSEFIDSIRGSLERHCPYGQPVDRLWVRETWCPGVIPGRLDAVYFYRADGYENDASGNRITWRPSIFMPRWASRITLEITNVRVERLQDIGESDILDEGVKDHFDGTTYSPLGYEFIKLWNSINAKRGYGWDTNPFVWVIEFKKITP